MCDWNVMTIQRRYKLASFQHLTKTLHVGFPFNLSPICRSAAIICPFAFIPVDAIWRSSTSVCLSQSLVQTITHRKQKRRTDGTAVYLSQVYRSSHQTASHPRMSVHMCDVRMCDFNNDLLLRWKLEENQQVISHL